MSYEDGKERTAVCICLLYNMQNVKTLDLSFVRIEWPGWPVLGDDSCDWQAYLSDIFLIEYDAVGHYRYSY